MEKSKGVIVVVVQGRQWDNDRTIIKELLEEAFIIGGAVRGGFECEMLVTKIPEVLQSLVINEAVTIEIVGWRELII